MGLPTGTIAFLFSDIEGSTARWESYREAMQRALARHDALMRRAIETRNGHVFKTVGDAFCAAFASVSDAVAAALDAQRQLAAENWDAIGGLRVRMAVHVGEAELREGDYFGPALNRVARLLAAAHGGQVVVSRAAATLAEGRLPAESALRDLGLHRLKDLPQPETIYQLVAADLRHEFPPLRSIAESPTNLPLELTTFLGREAEIAEIEQLVSQSRLVTLTGAGGVGKTRAALRIAAALLPTLTDGAWFVELAAVADPEVVAATIGDVFGAQRVSDARPVIEDTVAAIGSKQTLLVVDNCEHVIAAAAATIQTLLQRCSNLRVLATSREALGVAGERTFRMPSLDESTGIALFAERARAVQPRFTLDDANRETVAEIVRRLDGIALAIELAASRVTILSPDQINKRLNDRFKLLAGGSRSALPRQQTLRALIAWSYDLLGEEERSFINRLAIFNGGWTLDAAAEVCDDPRFPGWDALALMTSLAEKSLVIAESEGDEPRFRLLESTREFALERLKEADAVDTAAAKHCAYYRDLSDRFFDDIWNMNPHERGARLKTDRENFRAAIDWAFLQRRDVESGMTLVANLSDTTLFHDLRALIAAAIDSVTPQTRPELRGRLLLARLRRESDYGRTYETALEAVEILHADHRRSTYAEALMALGFALTRLGRANEAVVEGEKALAIARQVGQPRLIGYILSRLAGMVQISGDLHRALQLYQEAVAIFQELGEYSGMLSVALANWAEGLFANGEADEAIARAREALELDRDAGRHTAVINNNIAGYLLSLGRAAEAAVHAAAALDEASSMREDVPMAIAIGHLAGIAATTGDSDCGARLLGYADAVYARFGFTRELTERAGYEAAIAALNAALPAERVRTLMDEGAKLNEADAVREARRAARSELLANVASYRNDHISL